MSREVACKVLDPFFRLAEKDRIPFVRLLAGVKVPLSVLRNNSDRIDWSDFAQFMTNVGKTWPVEVIEDVGAGFIKSPVVRYMAVIAKLVFTAKDFFHVVFKADGGLGHQLFRCVKPSLHVETHNRLRLELRVEPGFTPVPEFFITTRGTFRGLPAILGLPLADVQMEWIPGGARYIVTLPEGGGTARKIWRAFTWVFTARAAAQELQAAHEDLGAKYRELEAAREALARQTEALQTAAQLGNELASKRTLPELFDAVGSLFRSSPMSFSRVALTPLAAEGELPRTFVIGSGQGARQELALDASGEPVGTLEVWGGASQDSYTLLMALAPWLSIALANVRNIERLERQAHALEHKVDARTTDLKTAKSQLEDSLDRALSAEKDQARFFANASHELRTPLTLMVSPLETLVLRGDVPDDARIEIRSSLSSAYRLLKLVNDLLDLAKTDAGEMRLRISAVNLGSLLEETGRVWQQPLAKRHVKLEVRFEENAVLAADRERLEQVLHNLLANAAKHTPDHGGVALTLQSKHGRHLIRVSNQGTPIDPEEAATLFERFAQSARASQRRFGSTGLGLSLVRELVALHGGNVSAHSEDGWTHFSIDLPASITEERRIEAGIGMSTLERRSYENMAELDEPAEPGMPAPVLGSEPAAAPTGPMLDRPLPLLLIVEDNRDLRAFMQRGLKDDYRLLIACDGDEGYALARTHAPDAILSDLMMPNMDGLELCRLVKSDPRLAVIPFLLITARNELSTKLTGFGTGADDFIMKPFHLAEVKARLQTQLRLRQALQELAHSEKLAALGTVVAGIAHELRNPLNGIVNALGPAAQLVADQSPEVSELLVMAKVAAERSVKLTTQLLDGARIEGGVFVPCELYDTLNLAVKLTGHLAENVSVQVEPVPEKSAVVLGQAGALTQAWVNLLENAMQAAKPTGKVAVRVEETDGEVRVSVSDDGPGIPPENLRRVFEPFFTTKGPGQGTGLGLALTRQTILLHGGKISATSQPGMGAVFSVTLPLATESERT